MAVAFVKNHTVASNKTAGTTLDLTLDTAVPAGNFIVCRMVFDNSATASAPSVATVAKQSGEFGSWSVPVGAKSTSTSAGAFAQGDMLWIRTNVTWAAGSYTVTLTQSVTQKAGFFQEFSGALQLARSTSGTNYSTTTTAASAATTGTAPVIGDLALGFIWGSNATTNQAGDNDTTAGSWSAVAGVGTTGGNVATNNWGVAQYKIVTGTSHQTLNNSAAMTAGNGAAIVVIQQYVPPAITQAAYQLYADGTETGSTALVAQDTAYGPTVDVDSNVQVRVRLQSTNTIAPGATDDWQLQYEKNTSGTWSGVTTTVVADSYPSGGSETVTNLTANQPQVGQSFTGNGKHLLRARFRLKKIGTPDGTNTAILYAHTGTFGSTGIPTGTALATSTTSLATSSLTTSEVWYSFDFAPTYTLANGTNYVIVLATTNSSTLTANSVQLAYADVGTHAGNRSYFNTTTWFTSATDLLFEIDTDGASVVPYDSANLTDGAATTNRLGAGTGSFVAGKVSEDGLVDDLGWTANNYTEVLYSVTLKEADLANGDVLRFRVLRNGATSEFTYTQVPTINVTKTLVAVTQAAYRWYDDGTETGAVALAAQDTAASGDVTTADGIGHLRVRLQSTSAATVPAACDWQLQWEKNTSGTWTNVVGASIASYSFSNLASSTVLRDTSPAMAQSFVGDGQVLTRAVFGLWLEGSPTGTLAASIWAHDAGAFGSAGRPTGSPLATSTNSVTAATLPSVAGTTFAFDFAGFTVVAGTQYFIGLVLSGAAAAPNYVRVGNDNTTPTHPGNGVFGTGPPWSIATPDFVFEVHSAATLAASTVLAYDSPNLTDGAATTNRLTGGSGSFVAGKVSETGLVTDVGWAGNNYTELLYSLDIVNTDVVNGDTLRFRILKDGATSLMTYTVTPQIDVVKTAPLGGKIKWWNGSAWVEKPVKVWNGSAWVEKPVKVWSGSGWVLS